PGLRSPRRSMRRITQPSLGRPFIVRTPRPDTKTRGGHAWGTAVAGAPATHSRGAPVSRGAPASSGPPASRGTLKCSTNATFRARLVAFTVPRGHFHRATRPPHPARRVAPPGPGESRREPDRDAVETGPGRALLHAPGEQPQPQPPRIEVEHGRHPVRERLRVRDQPVGV